MGSGDVSIPCGGERCPLRPPAVLCLQICALLFASLYILCHFVIRHFKKQTDFAAGRRVHPSNPPPGLFLLLPAPIPLWLRSLWGVPLWGWGSRAPPPSRALLSSAALFAAEGGAGEGIRGGNSREPSCSSVSFPLQCTMMRMLLSTGLRKFLPSLLPSLSRWDTTFPPVPLGDLEL